MKYTSFLLAFLALPAFAEIPAYQKAGLNSQEAAAHLLSRFSYGPRPGQVEAVVRQGLDNWLEEQLRGLPESDELRARLGKLPALQSSAEVIANTYLSGPELRRMGLEKKLIGAECDLSQPAQRRRLLAMARAQGKKTERDLVRELLAQKVLRASLSENQLSEVMTDFWFNHFNVSRTSNPARVHILSYERDVVRPHSLGGFRGLLGATARHPAMLLYLNNAQSMAPLEAVRLTPGPAALEQARRSRGINENYARELLELHTLGVDGGYSQSDVVEVARILTGWTTLPRGPMGKRLEKWVQQSRQPVHRGDFGFLFVPFLHDSGPKVVLGNRFEAGAGLQEGERLLDLLAYHPSTYRHLAHKLAVRFVSDEPDPALVEDLTAVLSRSRGQTSAALRALLRHPGFWSPQALRAKVKSPLEYCVSSLRASQANLSGSETEIPIWTEKMGQPLYGFSPPTGFPDQASHWVNSGTMVHRINFAFALAGGKIRGLVPPSLPAGNLESLAARLLPGRPLPEALKPVEATLKNEEFFHGLAKQGQELKPEQRVLGVLLSCPEFQRR